MTRLRRPYREQQEREDEEAKRRHAEASSAPKITVRPADKYETMIDEAADISKRGREIPGREYAEPTDEQLINFASALYPETAMALRLAKDNPTLLDHYRPGLIKIHRAFQNDLFDLRESEDARDKILNSDEDLWACHTCQEVGIESDAKAHSEKSGEHNMVFHDADESQQIRVMFREYTKS